MAHRARLTAHDVRFTDRKHIIAASLMILGDILKWRKRVAHQGAPPGAPL